MKSTYSLWNFTAENDNPTTYMSMLKGLVGLHFSLYQYRWSLHLVIVEGQSKSGLMVVINLESHFPKRDYYLGTKFSRHEFTERILVLLSFQLRTLSQSVSVAVAVFYQL